MQRYDVKCLRLEDTKYEPYRPCSPQGPNYEIYCPVMQFYCKGIGGGIYMYIAVFYFNDMQYFIPTICACVIRYEITAERRSE
jgi:hypothetical protein